MAIADRNLAVGTILTATFKKNEYLCTVEQSEKNPDKQAYRLGMNGLAYSSPSAAGSAVMGGIACNGWAFWSVQGAEKVARPVYGERKAKVAPVAVTPAAEPEKAAGPDLHAIFMETYYSFAVTTEDVAKGYFGGDTKAAYATLSKMGRKGLVVSTTVNGEGSKRHPGTPVTWQTRETYDSIDEAEAEAMFAAAYPPKAAKSEKEKPAPVAKPAKAPKVAKADRPAVKLIRKMKVQENVPAEQVRYWCASCADAFDAAADAQPPVTCPLGHEATAPEGVAV